MAELVDAVDSKSTDLRSWEFKSPSGHHFYIPFAFLFIKNKINLRPRRKDCRQILVTAMHAAPPLKINNYSYLSVLGKPIPLLSLGAHFVGFSPKKKYIKNSLKRKLTSWVYKICPKLKTHHACKTKSRQSL